MNRERRVGAPTPIVPNLGGEDWTSIALDLRPRIS